MSWRSCQSIRAIAPAEGKEQMTPPMCFEILPILCAFFYRVSIVHVYMSAASYLPPSNENRSSSLVLCGYQTPTTSPPQIGSTSQRADQFALAVRGLVGREGLPRDGWIGAAFERRRDRQMGPGCVDCFAGRHLEGT